MSKAIVTLPISEAHIEEVMEVCGYYRHNGGWVRDVTDRERFHIVYEDGFKLHYDFTTKKGFHKIAGFKKVTKDETKRIMTLYNQFYQTNKRKYKTEFAPNLKEIQRNHKTKIKRSIKAKILGFVGF